MIRGITSSNQQDLRFEKTNSASMGTSVGRVRLPLDFNLSVNGVQTDIRLFNTVAMHTFMHAANTNDSHLVIIMEK